VLSIIYLFMKRFISAIFLCFLIILNFTGCKLDPVIYPNGTPGADSGTDATYTVGLGNANTVIFKLNGGEAVTVSPAVMATVDPDDLNPDGSTGVSAGAFDSPLSILLSFRSAYQTGSFNSVLFELHYNGKVYKSDTDGGTFKITKYTNDLVATGYFSITAIDDSDNSSHTIVGSFNIQ